jgi:hypothetical protein
MKLWIIYKDGILIARIIAEMLQDRLENYVDVAVGKISKIEPLFILKEKLFYLIVLDIVNQTLPSVVIQKWVRKYKESNKKINLNLKTLSGCLISQEEIKKDTYWVEFIQSSIQTKVIYPPILLLQLNKSNLVLETDIYNMVKDYSTNFIEFIINKPENQTNEDYKRRSENLGKQLF